VINEVAAMMDSPDDFPLGDGVVDTEAEVQCPYCGELVMISLDPDGGSVSEYVEDCEVCCRPWQVRIEYASDGHASVLLETLDD
jgi:hypothetical protein